MRCRLLHYWSLLAAAFVWQSCLLGATQAPDETPSTKSPAGRTMQTTCTKTDTRTIITKSLGEGGCEVLYTKRGKTRPIASAQNETAYCESIADKVRDSLQDAQFSCDQTALNTQP